MRWGISGAPIPSDLPYAGFSNRVAVEENFSPAFLYAIGWREAIGGQVHGLWPDAATQIASDGGRGCCQLTSSYPDDWQDPASNFRYAVQVFLRPALAYWHGLQRFSGDTLILLAAATYNEGLSAAEKYHALGDVDAGTSDEYGHGILKIYQSLVATGRPE